MTTATIVRCLVCHREVRPEQATDVGGDSPAWVGDACLPVYFEWLRLQGVLSYVERYQSLCPLKQGVIS